MQFLASYYVPESGPRLGWRMSLIRSRREPQNGLGSIPPLSAYFTPRRLAALSNVSLAHVAGFSPSNSAAAWPRLVDYGDIARLPAEQSPNRPGCGNAGRVILLPAPAARMRGMKSISAAIIVLAGAALFIAGAYHTHSQAQTLVGGMGVLLGLVGLIGWVITLCRD
jgi:hypothetical protein